MTRVSLPWGAKAWTSTRSKRRASSRADQRARLKTAWNRLKWVSCSCPVARRAAVTVRRPRARIVPVTRTWAFSHVGRVKTERKWDRTDRMGVERDISGRSEGGSSIVSTRYYDSGHRDVPPTSWMQVRRKMRHSSPIRHFLNDDVRRGLSVDNF